MIATAKLETTGHQQTLRLPPGFELAGEEVWVRKDEATGEITLSSKAPGPDEDRLTLLFALLDESPLPHDFLAERENPVESPRNPLEDWTE
ncbi:antitoxin [Candidatus Thiodictyon syntrophicum]|uniref:AbrB family transcriptional regulator n=1 Tax=Candidatus Thiodictyon syntrophicum TaxID=1166950 RepID=A0A2K8U3E5_9GAMM|nr:AbrB family transcriptional regulator [Candidatus Thiodictyon syntrophicum]AUB80067.1 AbrB family transcriptional regulator [Candidatus Thiodictyon syntrophicum]